MRPEVPEHALSPYLLCKAVQGLISRKLLPPHKLPDRVARQRAARCRPHCDSDLCPGTCALVVRRLSSTNDDFRCSDFQAPVSQVQRLFDLSCDCDCD